MWMAAKKSDQRLRWERYLRIKNSVKQRHQKFMYLQSSNKLAVFGSYVQVFSNTPEVVEAAKGELMARYSETKVLLRSLKVELSPPEFIVKEEDLFVRSVAWRAAADKPLTIEMQRKIALRRKRARRARLNV